MVQGVTKNHRGRVGGEGGGHTEVYCFDWA